jgi:hypothetical protein
MAPSSVSVILEIGNKKVFASAVGWPGLSRSARDEDGALTALAEYRARYLVVAEKGGLRLPRFGPGDLVVAERLAGSGTTDFGAPGAIAELERRALSAAAARRQATLVEAAWAVLDRVAAHAPTTLRKGPRGRGRDRDAVVAHVLDAEREYARKLGLRLGPVTADQPDALSRRRAELIEVLGRSWKPKDGDKTWPPAYAARRIAWHVLDHAWEIEDRSSAGT